MMTLRLLQTKPEMIPAATAWYLADIGQAKGRQELFTRQTPQRLRLLREHALIESAVSSNRMEGVEIENARVGTIVFGNKNLRDRNEEEVRGYREALDLIHNKATHLQITEDRILKLHALTKGEIWDAGQYKENDGDIIERYENGSSRVRFKTAPASRTRSLWTNCFIHGEA